MFPLLPPFCTSDRKAVAVFGTVSLLTNVMPSPLNPEKTAGKEKTFFKKNFRANETAEQGKLTPARTNLRQIHPRLEQKRTEECPNSACEMPPHDRRGRENRLGGQISWLGFPDFFYGIIKWTMIPLLFSLLCGPKALVFKDVKGGRENVLCWRFRLEEFLLPCWGYNTAGLPLIGGPISR